MSSSRSDVVTQYVVYSKQLGWCYINIDDQKCNQYYLSVKDEQISTQGGHFKTSAETYVLNNTVKMLCYKIQFKLIECYIVYPVYINIG